MRRGACGSLIGFGGCLDAVCTASMQFGFITQINLGRHESEPPRKGLQLGI